MCAQAKIGLELVEQMDTTDLIVDLGFAFSDPAVVRMDRVMLDDDHLSCFFFFPIFFSCLLKLFLNTKSTS